MLPYAYKYRRKQVSPSGIYSKKKKKKKRIILRLILILIVKPYHLHQKSIQTFSLGYARTMLLQRAALSQRNKRTLCYERAALELQWD